MTPLHRHQLLLLTDAGWQRVLARPWDEGASECLNHWATHHLPLVVTRRLHAAEDVDDITVGLAAPAQWQRRRIALTVKRSDIACFDEFPLAARLAPVLPPRCRASWQQLCESLVALGATARVYGSHGWQLMSRLEHLHPQSDIDLWVAVDSVQRADEVAAAFDRYAAPNAPRLDGELVFPDGRAVAWREWREWRAGRCRAVLVKTLAGASLFHAATAPGHALASPW